MNRPWFSPSSKRDLLEILESIAKDKAGHRSPVRRTVGGRVLDACREFFYWHRAPDVLPDSRSWSFGNYVIFFRPVSDGIDVVRVVHGARDEGTLFA